MLLETGRVKKKGTISGLSLLENISQQAENSDIPLKQHVGFMS
jgi:hypothetical protein